MAEPCVGVTAWYESGAVATLIGVFVGYLISQFKDWAIRARRHKALWQSINAEIEACKGKADGFLRDPYKSPLYRLPTIAYLNCLPLLLADGTLNEDEAASLIAFFGEVETLNRGLDLASAARGNSAKLTQEDGRNRLKAKRICSTGDYYKKSKEISSKKSK